MSGHQGGKKSSDDNLVAALIFLVLIGFMLILSWVMFKLPIVLFLYAVDAIQYIPFYFLGLLDVYSTSEFMHVIHTLEWVLHPIKGGSQGTIDPRTISLNTLGLVQADIGHRTWFVYAGIMGYLWYKTKNEMKGDGVMRNFTLTGDGGISFIEYQSRYWTDAKFAVSFDPEDRPAGTEGPMKIIEWVKLYNIPLERDKGIDTVKAEQIFKKQIGRKWNGFSKEPFYVRAFLVFCMMSLQASEKEVNAFRNRINNVFYSDMERDDKEDKINEAIEEEISKDSNLIPEIEKVAEQHYYSNTVCLGVIGYSGPFRHWGGGQGIIICPSMYQWMLYYDRTLFMALQSHGKYGIKAFIEGAGVISHYQLERTTMSAQSDKYAVGAVTALSEELVARNIFDMDEFDKAISLGQRRYKVRAKMAAAAEATNKKRQKMLQNMDPSYK